MNRETLPPAVRIAGGAPSLPLYVSIAGLATLTPWSQSAIRRMISRGVFQRGVHYFQPTGEGGQVIFRLAAVIEFIEGALTRGERKAVPGVSIDVEGIREEALALLG